MKVRVDQNVPFFSLNILTAMVKTQTGPQKYGWKPHLHNLKLKKTGESQQNCDTFSLKTLNLIIKSLV